MMAENKPYRILCTGKIDLTTAAALTQPQLIELIEIPFIKTKLIFFSNEEKKKINHSNYPIIITSPNAALALKKILNPHTTRTIYCLKGNTANSLKKLFVHSTIIHNGNNATELANAILKTTTQMEFAFFCGNLSKPTLPQILEENKRTVHPFITYTTTFVHQKIDFEPQAILFFSSSAVHSYFKNNAVLTNTQLYAMGQPTEETLKQYTTNKIYVADQPNKIELVKKAIQNAN